MHYNHTSSQFDTQLREIHSKVLEMGGNAEKQVALAVRALQEADGLLVDKVLDDERRINDLEIEIDQLCANVIARRAPAAVDLRSVNMIIKATRDLERIGDEAKTIALASRELCRRGGVPSPKYSEIKRIAELVLEMLHASLNCLARLDSEAAPKIARSDVIVDDHFSAVLRELLTYMIEDPRTISATLDLIFIAKALERVGDHAKNIGEYVVYMVKGKDVRHLSLEELERAAVGN